MEGKMTLAQIIAMFSGLGPLLEPVLLNLEQNQVQPELKALIGTLNSNSDLAQLLLALDAGLDAFIQAEIKKLG